MSCAFSCTNTTPLADTDTGADTDTDSDTDADTDSDSDSDTDPPDGFFPDAGPWDWEYLPDAGDCGQEGCRQLTFGDGVDFLEWDVWGDLLFFIDGDSKKATVVDHVQNTQLEIPNAFPEIGLPTSTSYLYPTIFDQMVCYSRVVYSSMGFSSVICADLEFETQALVHHRPIVGSDLPEPAKYSDLYGNHFVSTGGCGELDSKPLCVFDLNAPGTYVEAAQSYYGGYNTIWENVVVWFGDENDGDEDIRGYDLSTSEVIEIAVDDEVQAFPRIKGTKVVYMDLRFGDSGYAGDWNHAAIFMYDLTTQETIQITDGSSIAIDPDLDGDIVVWMDYRACPDPNGTYESYYCAEVWGYNLDTETEFQITNLPGRSKQTPRIWGDHVFIQMSKVGGGDAIYMFDLPDGAK